MSDRSIAGTVGGKGKISSRKLKQLTETAIAQYAAVVSLERNPATFGDAVIDISNNLNVQSANAFSAVKRAFPSAFMDATLGADPAGIRQLPDNLVHLASVGAAGSWVHDGHSRAEDMEVVCGNGMGEDWSGGQAAWQQRGSAGLRMGHGARATPARSLPRSVY